MKFSKLAFVGTQFVARRQGHLAPSYTLKSQNSLLTNTATSNNVLSLAGNKCKFNTRLFSSGGFDEVTLQQIEREAMEEIIEDYEEGGREESGYVVMDVREEDEVASTGKISPNTITFPLQKLMKYNAFELDEDEFEEIFGFEKPALDETLVFTCLAGSRSFRAAQFAAQSGYTQLVTYKGGANEWFS